MTEEELYYKNRPWERPSIVVGRMSPQDLIAQAEAEAEARLANPRYFGPQYAAFNPDTQERVDADFRQEVGLPPMLNQRPSFSPQYEYKEVGDGTIAKANRQTGQVEFVKDPNFKSKDPLSKIELSRLGDARTRYRTAQRALGSVSGLINKDAIEAEMNAAKQIIDELEGKASGNEPSMNNFSFTPPRDAFTNASPAASVRRYNPATGRIE